MIKKWLEARICDYSPYQEECRVLKQQLEEQLEKQTELEKQNSDLQNQKNALEIHNQEISLKNSIISAILSAKNQNQALIEYDNILKKDFLEFANQENSLAEEAEVVMKLQKIYDELTLIASCIDLYRKNIIAVGGGFSSGKSEFISSFFEQGESKLAIGIEPMTAIPTYIIDHEERGLIGCRKNGGSTDLAKIDKEIQSKMSHSFIQSFGFNLREIMPFSVLKTNLGEWKNICFVDTPGYNPSASTETTSQDMRTAQEFLDNANVLIWLIGADSNGTISKSDLDFLKTIDLTNKKLYIVLNKADLKPIDDLQDIVSAISETLDFEEIAYEGVSAYSSRRKKEYIFHKMELNDFLLSCNHPSESHKELLLKLYGVEDMYRRAILTKKKENQFILQKLKSLSLDLLEAGVATTDQANETLGELVSIYKLNNQGNNLEKLEGIFLKFKNTIDDIFGSKVEINFKKFSEEDLLHNQNSLTENQKKQQSFWEQTKIEGQKIAEKIKYDTEDNQIGAKQGAEVGISNLVNLFFGRN